MNEFTQGQIVRSKAVWAEQGERSSKYFLNLQKHNQELKNITSITNDSNELITCNKGILNELYSFYSNLYKEKSVSSFENFNDFKSKCKLNDVDMKSLELNITKQECSDALDELASGKSPGSDGLSTEFKKKFWPTVISVLKK